MNKKNWDDYPNLLSTTPFDYKFLMECCPMDSKILDIGCGYGRICMELENLGYRDIVGIDISRIQIERAKKNLNYTKLSLIDENDVFSFEDSSFDSLISLGVIDCIIDTVRINSFIKECTRVLKNNGYWFVNFYTRNDSKYFDVKYEEGMKEFGIKRVFQAKSGIKFRHYSLWEFINLIDKEYDVVRCNLHEFLSFNQSKTVKGYSVVLKKISYKSIFR